MICSFSVKWPSVALALLFCVSSGHAQKFQCDPCIDRSQYTVKMIVHGSATDVLWQQIEAAARQSQLDMGINLEMHMIEDEDVMISEIQKTQSSQPDALIVSVPSAAVEDAVEEVIEAGIPTFGVNIGDQIATNLFADFVGMDQELAGRKAAEEIIRLRDGQIGRALFINHDVNDISFEERYNGFDFVMPASTTSLVVDGSNPNNMETAIDDALQGCGYDAVLLAGPATVDYAVSAFEKNSCPGILATFDTTPEILAYVAQDRLSFAVGEQPFLQGALPVLMAAMFATTGNKIVRPSTGAHIYLSGPKIVELSNLPSDTMQTCEFDGFPVCPNTLSIDGATPAICDCTVRESITIAGVLHGVTTDVFWDPVFAASEQAARDMGVELLLDRFEPVSNQTLLHEKMAEKMKNLCQQNIDGLFVTIPSSVVEPALLRCKELGVPIVSINTGISTAEEMGLLHHVGMLEYNAGVGAGQRLVQSGMKKGLCLDHEPGNTALIDRCNGFSYAISQSDGVEYLGKVNVPLDNAAQYKAVVEEAIGEDGDWNGVGLFLLGPAQTNEALLVKEDHPFVIMGSVDTSEEMYAAIDEGKILFGIQQGPYMQGYMPIPMLTWLAYTGQSLVNIAIESGPSFVESSPSDKLRTCESNLFEVCTEPDVTDFVVAVSSAYGNLKRIVPFVAVLIISLESLVGWLF